MTIRRQHWAGEPCEKSERGSGDSAYTGRNVAVEDAMRYRRISADCHLDLPWLPADLFVENAARDLKNRMPFVEDGAEGPRWVTKAGVFVGIPGAVGSVGAPFVP